MSVQKGPDFLWVLLPRGEHDVQDAVVAECREVEVRYGVDVGRGAGAEVVPLWEGHCG